MTVKEALGQLKDILRKAKGSDSSSDSSQSADSDIWKASPASKAKSKKSKKSKKESKKKMKVVENTKLKQLGASTPDLSDKGNHGGARPKRPPRSIDNKVPAVKPLMDIPPPGRASPKLKDLGVPSRNSPHKAKDRDKGGNRSRHGSGNKEIIEEVKLTMSHQYIEYQFMDKFWQDVIDPGSCCIE